VGETASRGVVLNSRCVACHNVLARTVMVEGSPAQMWAYCFRIQFETFSSATGDIVSSICAYSAGAPVFAVWKR
jgi:hypothetical protein